MADRVGIDPAGARLTNDLRHSIEHARAGLDVHPRVADKENIGIGSVEESLNARGRVVLWIDDVHESVILYHMLWFKTDPPPRVGSFRQKLFWHEVEADRGPGGRASNGHPDG